jgi:NAD(P)-dependent dehydrogenase (short-subunit alcohol dehydrogenase family)
VRPEGTAVVTGASRGIGRAVALELAARGFDVIATMRDPADGATLADDTDGAPGTMRVERLDVTDPASIRLPDRMRVLVNNAGVEAEHPPFEATPLELWRRMYETNVFGLIDVSRRAVPAMRAAGGGVLCNVTSSSILAPVPFFAPYRSSKAAVSAIGESLRAELAPFGIRVLEIMPGPIDTDMLAGSDRPPEAIEHEEYRAMAQRYYEGRRNVDSQVTSTGDAARTIVDAVLDDASPLRVACDPLAAGLLDAWRASSDEDLMRAMLSAWTGEAT